MKEIILPIVVSVISAIFTAYVTIHIHHSKNKEEALNSLKAFIIKGVAVVWSIWLVYGIIQFVISTEEITRSDVFKLVMYVFSLLIMFLNIVINKILNLIGRL